MKIKLTFLILLFCSSLFSQEIEHTYSNKVRTIQLYLSEEDEKQVLNAPIITLNSENPLILEFDWVDNEPLVSFQFKIFHCNKEWEKSNILDQDFLDEFNEFFSYDIFPSSTRATQYYHCKAELPTPKLSGNYLLYVYETENENKPILTRKFITIENAISIIPNQNVSTVYKKKQGIDFTINFNDNYPFDFKDFTSVFLRKNERWNTIRKLEKEASFNPNTKTIAYTSNFSNTSFYAGNEYYQFDSRNEQGIGINTRQLQRSGDTIYYFLFPDETLLNTYFKYQDINGKFIIDNYLFGEGNTNSEYIKAIFTLDYSLDINGEIYLIGAFNNWEIKKEYQLFFNPDNRKYQAEILLKQGYYNYKYVFQNRKGYVDENYFSGNFNQTENEYEIIVYYYDQELQTDKIIGYRKLRLP